MPTIDPCKAEHQNMGTEATNDGGLSVLLTETLD